MPRKPSSSAKIIWIIVPILGVVVIAALTAYWLATAEFQEFTSPEGRFKVLMPGTPQKKSQTVAGITVRIFAHERSSGTFFVSYRDLPVGIAPGAVIDANRVSNGLVDRFLRGNPGTELIKSTAMLLQGKFHGAEIWARNRTDLLRVRLYWAGARLYQLQSQGTDSWVQSEDSDRFLRSFAVVEAPEEQH